MTDELAAAPVPCAPVDETDDDIQAAMSTFENGCDFTLHFSADGSVRLGYGCYGVHWNLVQGARFRVSRWLGFDGEPKVVQLAPDTLRVLKERQPCRRCGGFTFEPLRATGEGARDARGGVRSDAPSDAGRGETVEEAQDGTEHERGLVGPECPVDHVSSPVHSAARAAEQVRAQIGRVRVALLREDSQRAETLFRAASGLCIAASMALKELPVTEPADAPPVAVSLDPHRLPSAWSEFGDGHDYSRTGKHDPNACRFCLQAELARLRGEATVRVEE